MKFKAEFIQIIFQFSADFIQPPFHLFRDVVISCMNGALLSLFFRFTCLYDLRPRAEDIGVRAIFCQGGR